jgi:hypothetical protein
MSLSLSRGARFKKGIFYFFLASLLPLSYQCVKAPLEPKMPTWTTQLTIPLFDRSWTFADMIKKDPKFDTTSGISVIYRPSSIKNNPTAIDIPALSPAQGQVTNKLGVVPLDIPALPGFTATFRDMFGVDPPTFNGNPVPYPGNDTTVTPAPIDIGNPSATYDWMIFENGTMTLTITNTFQFGVSFPSGIRIVNDSDQTVVATFNFAGVISPNTFQSATSDLAGVRMDAKMHMSFTLQTDQINGKTIQSTDNISAVMAITNAGLSSAKLQLVGDYPLINVQDSVQKLDDSTGVFRAEFSGGSFDVKIINDIATSIVVSFTLDEFINKATGKPFKLNDQNGLGTPSDSVIIGPKTTYDMPVSMKDYILQSQHIDTLGIDTLSTKVIHFSLSIKTLVRTNNKRVISKDDSVVAAIIPNQADNGGKYTLSYVRGKVKPTPEKIHFDVPVTIGDIGNKFTSDSVTFDSVTITVNILSTGLFPTDVNMTIYALDKNGDVGDSLVVPPSPGRDVFRILPGDSAHIVFTKGTGVSRFLASFFGRTGRLPDKLLVEGNALIDPMDVYLDSLSTGTVQEGDSIYTSVDLSFPIRLGIVNGVLRDTIALGKQNIDKNTYSKVETGNIYFKIENGFPFRLNVSADMFKALATDSSQIDTNSLLISLPRGADSTTGRLADPPIVVDSSTYFSGGGQAISYTYISLIPADVEKITSADIMAVRIKLKTSGNSGETVIFQTSDLLHLKIFANVSYNVDFSNNK